MTPTPSYSTEEIDPKKSPFSTNFSLAMAADALDNETEAYMIAAITKDPANPDAYLSSIRLCFPDSATAHLLVNLILSEIDKEYFDHLLSDDDDETVGCEEEEAE